MAKLVSKVYGDALFEAALEDNKLSGLFIRGTDITGDYSGECGPLTYGSSAE